MERNIALHGSGLQLSIWHPLSCVGIEHSREDFIVSSTIPARSTTHLSAPTSSSWASRLLMSVVKLHGLLFAKKRHPLAHVSCEAKIQATNEESKLVVALRHLTNIFLKSGCNIPDTIEPLSAYNDNESSVSCGHITCQLSKSAIWKCRRHECVQSPGLPAVSSPC